MSDLFFLVLCRDERTHLRVLARLGRMIQLDDFLEELRGTEEPNRVFELICAADAAVGSEE